MTPLPRPEVARSRLRRGAVAMTALALAAGAAVAAAPQASAAAGCQVAYTITSQWSGGFGANIDIKNLGDPISSWALKFSFTAGQTVAQLWNGTVSQTGSNVTVTNASYNGGLGTGATTQVGFNGTWDDKSNPAPPAFTLNGVTCTGSVTTSPSPGPTASPTRSPSSSPSPTRSPSPSPSPTASATPTRSPDGGGRPRVIALTDGEVDDRSTMIRFLHYTSDFDVAGIVQTNSRYQKSGHSRDKWVEAELANYAKVLPNLRRHNPNYPDASYLQSVVRVGNENSADLNVAPPDMATKNTPGEQLIINTLLDNDPRPVHITVWGGANTVASALWRLKTSYSAADYKRAVSKVRIYCIWYQDGGGQWIEDNIREAYINEAYRWDNVWDYQSLSGPSPDYVKAYMTSSWLDTNVKSGHGPLGAMYPQSFVSEGDTPSFLHEIANGLDADEDYTLGGWGGRSVFDDPANKPNHLTDSTISDDGDRNKMYWRWVPAAQNDFAARMDWDVASSYSGANHQPNAKVNGSLRRNVSPGQVISLDASPSTDPDGNALSYHWWEYGDADSVSAKVSVGNATSKNAAGFVVPNEPGKQIHIILEVTDNGTPALTSYQRIIFTIVQ